MSPAEKYRALAEAHAAIDYGDKKSVKAGNKAADELRKLGSEILTGDDLATMLAANNAVSVWAAHHILEFHNVQADVRKKAIGCIENEILKGGPNAMGSRIFLESLK